jgi:hypothetical protein
MNILPLGGHQCPQGSVHTVNKANPALGQGQSNPLIQQLGEVNNGPRQKGGSGEGSFPSLGECGHCSHSSTSWVP